MNSPYYNANSRPGSKLGVGCCAEITHDSFSLQDSNGKTIDLQRSFAPAPQCFVLCVKLLLTGWSLQVLFGSVFFDVDPEERDFFMAYLTNWGLVIAVLYLVMSCIAQLLPPSPTNTLNWFITLLWAIFAIASTIQGCLTILYWALVYTPDHEVNYYEVMKHGGLMIFCWVDGLLVNRVPVRFRHLAYPFGIAIFYFIWTLIHAFLTDIGNPDINNTPGDDDAIYSVISWKRRFFPTLLVFLLILFILLPLVFMLIYVMSLPFRRYIQSGHYPGTVELKPKAATASKTKTTEKKTVKNMLTLGQKKQSTKAKPLLTV